MAFTRDGLRKFRSKTHQKVYVYEWKHNSVTGENKSKTSLWAEIVCFVNGYFYMRKSDNRLKAPANKDTLLRTHCCRHICFSVCPHAQHLSVADTNFVSGTQEMFLILFRNILCPQQMFPILRSQEKSWATMCPRVPGPLRFQ